MQFHVPTPAPSAPSNTKETLPATVFSVMAPTHVPCTPFHDLVRLGFATAEDTAKVIQRGVREDDEAQVHRATGGPFFLSFKPGSQKNDYQGDFVRENMKMELYLFVNLTRQMTASSKNGIFLHQLSLQFLWH